MGPQVIQPIAPQPPVQVIQAPYVLSDAILKYVEENVPLLEREYVKARLVAYVNMMTQTKISQMPPHASSPFTPNILVTPQDIVTIMGQRLAPTESTVSIDKFSSVSSNLPSRQENGSVEPGPTCGSHTPIETNATSVQPNTQYKNGSVVADPPHSNSPIRMKPSRSIDSDSDRSLKKAKLRTESPTLVDDDVIVIEEDFKDPEMESESVPKAKAKKETVTGPLPSRSFQWQDGFVQGFFFYLGKDSPFGSVKDDDALSADWLDGFKTGTRYVETKEKEGLK